MDVRRFVTHDPNDWGSQHTNLPPGCGACHTPWATNCSTNAIGCHLFNEQNTCTLNKQKPSNNPTIYGWISHNHHNTITVQSRISSSAKGCPGTRRAHASLVLNVYRFVRSARWDLSYRVTETGIPTDCHWPMVKCRHWPFFNQHFTIITPLFNHIQPWLTITIL